MTSNRPGLALNVVLFLVGGLLLALGLIFLCAGVNNLARLLIALVLLVAGGGLAAWAGVRWQRARTLSPDVLDAILNGDMLFAIDSQQYMQGYLPIVLLTLYATNLNTIANPVLMTGPGFVTQENAAEVIALAEQGTR